MKTFVKFFCICLLLLPLDSSVKAQDVFVNATVKSCLLSIKLLPEKRIPRENNWQNTYQIIFYNSLGQNILEFNKIVADENGILNLELCKSDFSLEAGTYTVYVKGFSHLGKIFIENDMFYNYKTELDFSNKLSDQLLAGDVLDHNYINGLDLNVTISNLYSSNLKSDFNRDGIVNSLDLSNQIFNLHLSGDL